MGDKSPKSKERSEKQKVAATVRDDAAAKSKQDGSNRGANPTDPIAPKGKK